MRGLGRAKRTLRRVQRRFRPVAIILMYHRITDVPIDPRRTAVSPGNFAQHLDYIRETCHPMPLLDLVEALRKQSVPRRAVVVTFDDGHASVFERAYPLLASAGIPATAFVTTGRIDDPHDFWWDELDRVLLLPDSVPEYLHLRVGGREHAWATGHREARLQAYREIHGLIRMVPDGERQDLLASLSKWAGAERTAPSDCRPMTSAELVVLDRDGVFELGAHTVTHPVLAALPTDDQHAEIIASRTRLEAITGRPVLSFAYPYGQVEHYTNETVRIVQAAGFQVACIAKQGLVQPGNDLFRLHRCEIQDWDIGTFRKHLEWLFVS